MWLRSNNGDHGEAEACRAVAEWIDRQRTTAMLRQVVRGTGVSVSQLRKRLAEKESTALAIAKGDAL
jgi:hypothetical protein